MKVKVLCICAQGINRSKYLSEYLRRKGYSTKFRGVEDNSPNKLDGYDVEWADVIIIVRERLHKLFKKKYPKIKKKIIVLEVTDSKRLIPEEYAHLKELDYLDFQKKWTRPNLRNAIKEHLPLRK